jgi:hypothetical protein
LVGAGNSAAGNLQLPSTATSGYVVVGLGQSVPGMGREGSQRGQCSCFKSPFIATLHCSYKRGLKAATFPSL